MNLARLLLVNPPFKRGINGQLPLNLAYLAAAFNRTDVQVEICDLNVLGDPSAELRKRVENFQPTHAGVARYSPNCRDSIDILRRIRGMDESISLISGGPHEKARAHETRLRHPWINHVIGAKNAEVKLVRLVTGNPNAIVDWKRLFPAYHLLDLHEPSYHFDDGAFPGKKMISYMSARGCNRSCSFCSHRKYEALEIPVVLEHLERLEMLGYNAVFFNDPNFASDTVRTEILMEQMIEAGISDKIEWGCQTIANQSLTTKLLEAMQTAGCTYITYSLENVSKSALKLLNKRIDPETVASICAKTRELKMRTGLYVMFGIERDEFKDLEQARYTLDFLAMVKPDFVSYSIYTQYPDMKGPGADVDYESFVQTDSPAWDFFDEGFGYHPNCSEEHAVGLMKEIKERHEGPLKEVRIF